MIWSTCRLLLLVSAACALEGASLSFAPAYIEPGSPDQLTLFPIEGPELKVALPAGLPTRLLSILAFGPDGKTIYAQKNDVLNHSNGIYKIEFHPARESVVPGSVGMGQVSCLAALQSGQIITVEGWSWSDNSRGIF